jgi:hypothetical protein
MISYLPHRTNRHPFPISDKRPCFQQPSIRVTQNHRLFFISYIFDLIFLPDDPRKFIPIIRHNNGSLNFSTPCIHSHVHIEHQLPIPDLPLPR